jgi:hypothetical protein
MGTRYPSSAAVTAASTLKFLVEVPTGIINSINTTFQLLNSPAPQALSNAAIFLNGLIQRPTTDYTINSSGLITFAIAPTTGDTLVVCYVALI